MTAPGASGPGGGSRRETLKCRVEDRRHFGVADPPPRAARPGPAAEALPVPLAGTQ